MNRRDIILGACALPWLAPQSVAETATNGPDLSYYPLGPLPSDFEVRWRTGQGEPGDWQVIEDSTASQGTKETVKGTPSPNARRLNMTVNKEFFVSIVGDVAPGWPSP